MLECASRVCARANMRASARRMFVCADDISSPEADAPWPSLTPLGDVGLHRRTRIYVRRNDGGAKRELFLLVRAEMRAR